jgi:hypothetical protein
MVPQINAPLLVMHVSTLSSLPQSDALDLEFFWKGLWRTLVSRMSMLVHIAYLSKSAFHNVGDLTCLHVMCVGA